MASSSLNHVGTVELHTRHLTLRRLWLDDAQAMHDNWEGDPRSVLYLSHSASEGAGDLLRPVSETVSSYADNRTYVWIVCVKGRTSSTPVGIVTIYDVDDDVRDGKLGFVISKKWRRAGVPEEAVGAVLSLMFSTVGLECVRSFQDTRDADASWALDQLGFSYDGVLRRAIYANAGIGDLAAYSLLKDEWKSRR